MFNNFIITKEEKTTYYQENNNLLQLIIPKINLEQTIYNMDSPINNVEKNVEILKDSNIKNNTYFLASHSGTGDNCFFNRIKELNYKDNIYIIINNKKLIYEVTEIYYIVKNGTLEIDSNITNTVYLITCSTTNSNRQLIIKGILVN